MDLSVVISAFSLLFLAEMGDKTQLAIIALVAGTGEIWSVFVGSTLALWVVSLIGILFGATLLRKIPRHWVHRAAALLFVTFGILALGQVILSENALGVAKNLRGQSMSTCENGDDLTSHLDQIQALYTELAETPDKDFGWGKGRANARLLGYGEEWLRRLPEPVWESAAAVGNPFSVSPIGDGQTIVDLGCGAGADACVAALLVGETGHVIGVDCTPAMIIKARANAVLAGFTRIELHETDMTSLPIADGCADVVISNGAINLSTDKERVLAEAYRVLRPGGRLQIADMVKDPSAEAAGCCAGKVSWADCVSGTLDPDAFIALMEQAGFSNIELIAYTGYRTAAHTVGALFSASRQPGS